MYIDSLYLDFIRYQREIAVTDFDFVQSYHVRSSAMKLTTNTTYKQRILTLVKSHFVSKT